MKFIKALKFAFVLSFAWQIASVVIIAGAAPLMAEAQNNPEPTIKPIYFQPQVQIPNSEFEKASVAAGSYDETTGKTNSDLLAKYIQAFYNYGLAIAGILAAIVLMAGGVLWLTSAGNDTKVSQAKELISGSIIGSVILFGAWMILNTINPDLMRLKAISTQVVNRSYLGKGCCQQTGGSIEITESKNCEGIFNINQSINPDTKKCEDDVCCIHPGGSCEQTQQTRCKSKTGNYVPQIIPGSCAAIEDCADTPNCKDRQDGDPCYGEVRETTQGSFCYNGSCYYPADLNKIDSPCGQNYKNHCATACTNGDSERTGETGSYCGNLKCCGKAGGSSSF